MWYPTTEQWRKKKQETTLYLLCMLQMQGSLVVLLFHHHFILGVFLLVFIPALFLSSERAFTFTCAPIYGMRALTRAFTEASLTYSRYIKQ